MRTIGLVGGMSRESSVVYYRLVNEGSAHALLLAEAGAAVERALAI